MLVSPLDAIDGGTADAEFFGDFGSAFSLAAQFFNPFIGQVFKICFIAWQHLPFFDIGLRDNVQDIFYLDDRAFDDQYQSFDDMSQLAYIAWPWLILKEIPDFGIKGMGFMVANIQSPQQRLGNFLYISLTLAQRRDFNGQNG